jgi:hypothetical protein
VALNQEFTGCELKRASQSGGVRFFVRALACFASAHLNSNASLKLSPVGSVKQSYNRLSDDIQAAIYSPLKIAETVRLRCMVSFLTCRPSPLNAAAGMSAFLVSR